MTPSQVAAKPRVLIFRNELLPSSETFIRAQAGALQHFEPRYGGVHVALDSLQLPSSPILMDAASSVAGKLRRRLFWRLTLAPGFMRKLRRANLSLVHAHFALDGAAALPIARRLHIPLVVTLHGYDVTSSDRALGRSPEGRLYLRRRERLWKHAAVFLCVSHFVHDRALALGFPREKLRVLYTGIDLNLFKPPGLRRDPNLIVFVGRLVEKKGCRQLLDALEIVRARCPDVRLLCIGGGPLDAELRARVQASDLPCTFLGSQPAPIVKRCLAQASIFCAPSVTAPTGDSEGLGMVFAEAQAMGTPVVSFRHGGIPEVVLDGETGLLAPEGDTGALASHLITLLTDAARWNHLSAHGRRWVEQTFDLHRQTSVLESIYNEVLRR